MAALSPLQIALLIVALVAIVGVTITAVRSRMTFNGYEDIVHDVNRLGAVVHGEIFRDGSDVVVSGTFERLPAVVRFSNAENTPGLNIRMQAPATFLLSVVPANAQVTEGGRIPVRTTDELFDTRFTTRTDQPTSAKMFITKQTTGLLQRLACSKNTYLAIGSGAIELSELVIPTIQPGQHVIDHLKAMVRLSGALREMPGSDTVKLVTFERERHVAARIAMVVGAIVALGSIFAATQVPNHPPTSGVNQTLASGVLPLDAYHIPNTADWHTAAAEDLDPVALNWLRGNGVKPEARIEADLSGKATGRDVAYLLVGPNNQRRIVLLAEGENRYDTKFPYLGLAVRIPKGIVESISWVGGKPPEGIDGDGIMILRKQDDPTSAIVLFLSGHGIVSASPVNYQQISLQ
ncbi:MAG: hypothetical protein ACR2IF_15995 [Terriglobales bacterium]